MKESSAIMLLLTFMLGLSMFGTYALFSLERNQFLLKEQMEVMNSGWENDCYQYNYSRGSNYNTNTTNVYIKSFGRKPQALISDAYHEVGHYLWYEHLTVRQRNEWRRLEFKENVTDYASVSYSENFADTFEAFMLNNLTQQPQLDYFERHDIALIYRGG